MLIDSKIFSKFQVHIKFSGNFLIFVFFSIIDVIFTKDYHVFKCAV